MIVYFYGINLVDSMEGSMTVVLYLKKQASCAYGQPCSNWVTHEDT